ncbi:unnamed protein product [Owenia fusiformis]|uniref:Methyltransferase type 11 domain-containing protein n=1 Tax=Owenia fusiformis TaxID=6347 RepID=A0A8S4PXD9_OWEFU|nr:unnamed protein product [Owenia fusiformis]
MEKFENMNAKICDLYKPTLSQDDVLNAYGKWSEGGKYDKELPLGVYNGPRYAAEAVNMYIPNKDARIIDVAAGTGKVAEELQKLGFMNLDALDPSTRMLKIAREKQLYKNHIPAFILETGTPILDDEYDGLVTSGGMGDGHIPPKAMHEMARVVKPGGVICLVMREEFLTSAESYKSNALEHEMLDMEKRKIWIQIARNVVQGYVVNRTGVVFAFKVL